MPFDSTPGSPTATSYLSVERADEIASERLHSSAWDLLETNDKQRVLMTATRLLDSRVCVLGSPTFDDQSLLFPRTGLTNRNGREIDPDTIPPEIEFATFDYGLVLLPADNTMESSIAAQGITKLKAGPVELSFKDDIQYNSSVPANVLAFIPSWWLCPEKEEDEVSPADVMFCVV
jgi:hypothetical protein